MDRLIHQIPRFFSPGHVELLAEAMGTTLALTFIGCITGLLLAFLLVFLRQTPGYLGLPLRIVAIGSSSTAGLWVVGRAATYPEVMRRELSRLWPNARVEVVNSDQTYSNTYTIWMK